jgi:hypothetical protein
MNSLFANSQAFYDVFVDTSAISGTTGFVDFAFNPTPGAQLGFAEILNFAGGTLMGVPTVTGDVSGTLPGILILNNDTPVNEYFQGFIFGPSMTFNLLMAGPAISNPGSFAVGSLFSYGMLDPTGTPVLTTDPAGSALNVAVNPGGTIAITTFPSSPGGPPIVNITPEPASVLMLFSAVSLLGLLAILRKRTSRVPMETR